MAPHKDPVWEYGKRLAPRKFKCSFCKDNFSGTATRLKIHLSQVRGRNIRSCPDVPPEVRDKCLHWLLGGSSNSSSETGEGSRDGCDEQDAVMSVRKSVYRFLQSSGLPLEMVEDAAFVDMFCTITHFGSTGVPAPTDLHELAGFIDDDFVDWD